MGMENPKINRKLKMLTETLETVEAGDKFQNVLTSDA